MFPRFISPQILLRYIALFLDSDVHLSEAECSKSYVRQKKMIMNKGK